MCDISVREMTFSARNDFPLACSLELSAAYFQPANSVFLSHQISQQSLRAGLVQKSFWKNVTSDASGGVFGY
jgi:hypothetical protein